MTIGKDRYQMNKTKPLQQLNADFLKKDWTYEK
jgi:hypothetical protein